MIKPVIFLFCMTIMNALNAQMLNEILSNPNGSDSNCEYVEIRGISGEGMDDIYFISVEGDSTSTIGSADRVVDLTGTIIGSNGLLVITNDSTGGCTRDYNVPDTTRLSEPFFSMENGTTSFLLVFSPVELIEGTDYDSDNDGILELDAAAVILDAVAHSDDGVDDVTFGEVEFFLESTFGPDMSTRFFDNTNANDQSAWVYGDMEGANTSLMYDASQVSDNFTSNIALTPGAHNPVSDIIFKNGFENLF